MKRFASPGQAQRFLFAFGNIRVGVLRAPLEALVGVKPMRVVFLVPRKPDHGRRDQIWRWVKAFLLGGLGFHHAVPCCRPWYPLGSAFNPVALLSRAFADDA